MAKIRIEVCIISAHGLRRRSLLKPHWFAVGWIDPNDKYCTKIDASGSLNPTWRTKFSVSLDETESSVLQRFLVTIEVYRREPIFLRERLEGSAIVPLKEFLADFEQLSSATEKVATFQLRKGKPGKPKGFVDISIRISMEGEGLSTGIGAREGFAYSDQNEITLAIEDGPAYINPRQLPPSALHPTGGYNHQKASRFPTPPPPDMFVPPGRLLESGTYMPPSKPASRSNRRLGFEMGLGDGALAAGAAIFGRDFLLGFDYPASFEGGSPSVFSDPPT